MSSIDRWKATVNVGPFKFKIQLRNKLNAALQVEGRLSLYCDDDERLIDQETADRIAQGFIAVLERELD